MTKKEENTIALLHDVGNMLKEKKRIDQVRVYNLAATYGVYLNYFESTRLAKKFEEGRSSY